MISHQLSPFGRRFHDIQIVIITNFAVASSVGIKRINCIHICQGTGGRNDEEQTMIKHNVTDVISNMQIRTVIENPPWYDQ